MSAAQVMSPSRYDQPAMVATIKATVAKGASDAQLRMFLEVCRSTGLDPFLKEIYFVPEKGLIMAARDGYLRVANEHPQFDGMRTTVERDEKNVPIKATCSVWRKDRSHAITCEAYYSEYRKTSPVWSQYPSAMIGKVAEVLALKRSFAINGVVTEEEIGNGEPRGSAEAAAEVAREKIAILSKPPQLAAAIAEQVPEPEDEDRYTYEPEFEERSPLERELHESIVLVEKLKPQTRPNYELLLLAFGGLKARFQAIGYERTYYGWLAQYGLKHASEFTDTDEGLRQARCCYKEMSLDAGNREVRAPRSATA